MSGRFCSVAVLLLAWLSLPADVLGQSAPPGGVGGNPNSAPPVRRRGPPPPDPLRNTQPPVTDDWLTFGHDPQRTGWNNADTTFNIKNVSRLKLLWSSQLSAVPSPHATQTLTTPVVVSGVQTSMGARTLAFTISGYNTLFAIDVADGKVAWQKKYENALQPLRQATRLCANAEQATPVIDKQKGLIYFTVADGNLHGVSLTDGSEKIAPAPVVAPNSRN